MKVEIKTWKEMEAEFGLDDRGNIDCFGVFTVDMEAYLPYDRIISVDADIDPTMAYWEGYAITKNMIKRVVEE